MITAQEVFDIFGVSYDSPAGEYYPKNGVKLYTPCKFQFISLIYKLPYGWYHLFNRRVDDKMPPCKIMQVTEIKSLFIERNTRQFYFAIESAGNKEIINDSASIFTSVNECIDYIVTSLLFQSSIHKPDEHFERYIYRMKKYLIEANKIISVLINQRMMETRWQRLMNLNS